MMVGLDFVFGPSYEIVIVGNKYNKYTKKIIQYLNSIYQPNKIIILKELGMNGISIENLVPFIKNYSQINNQVTIYLCRNQQCQLPLTDIEKLKQFLV